MASLRNITYEDQGVNWKVNFEYRLDGTSEWLAYEANFPADFGQINADDIQPAMLDIALWVARGEGIEI